MGRHYDGGCIDKDISQCSLATFADEADSFFGCGRDLKLYLVLICQSIDTGVIWKSTRFLFFA